MDLKNKVSFFLLSFFLSFSLFFTSQKYFVNLIINDLIAYAIAIFCIALIPLILYLILPIMNKKLLVVIYLISLLFAIKLSSEIDFNPLKHFLTLNILPIIFIFIFSLIITVLLKINLKNQFLTRLKKIISSLLNTQLIKFLGYLSAFLLISFLIYNPKYRYSFEKLSLFGYESYHQFHHVTFFVIPINEILLGKILLINVSSLYGIILTYLNTLIFKIIGLTFSNFVLFNMVVTIIYTWIFFLILKKITNNYWLALIGTIAYIRLAIFRDLLPGQEIFILPSTTPIRHFFDLIIFYQIYNYFQQSINFKRLLLMSSTVIFTFFYSFDFGFFIALAYIMTLLFDILLSIFNQEKIHKIISKAGEYLASLVLPFIFFGLMILLYIFFKSGNFPNLSQYIYHLATQTVQLKDLSLPSIVDWHYLPLLIYLLCFYYVFNQSFFLKEKGNQWLVFLLIYGLFIFTYYINLSEPNHLFSIIHPSLIIFFLLLKATKNKPFTSFVFSFILIVLIFGIFWAIFIGPPSLTKIISEKINYRYSSNQVNYYLWGYPGTDFYLQDDDGKNFELAADKIKQLTKRDKEVVIISRYSALLFLMSGKTSLINHPNIENDIYSIEELNEAVDKVKTIKPKYIFYHSPEYNQWHPNPNFISIRSPSDDQWYFNTMKVFWEKIKKDYTLKENSGVVDVYQLIK